MEKIEQSTYGCRKALSLPFPEAVARIRAALKEEGFGILTEIDVAKTMKEKLDADFPAYLILGACHPKLAYSALRAEREIGLMLPCNVIVYEDDGRVIVSAIRPAAAMAGIANDRLKAIANQVETKLIIVIESI